MPGVRPHKFAHVVYRTRRFDEMIEWTPKNFLTIELNRPPEELAAWIDGYFKEVLGCDPGHQLRWGREQ